MLRYHNWYGEYLRVARVTKLADAVEELTVLLAVCGNLFLGA